MKPVRDRRFAATLAAVLIVGIVGIGVLGWAVNEVLHRIDNSGREASLHICRSDVEGRARSRRLYRLQIERNRKAVIPPAAALGLVVDPATEAYIKALGDSLLVSQVGYYKDRPRESPPLRCALINERFLAVKA